MKTVILNKTDGLRYDGRKLRTLIDHVFKSEKVTLGDSAALTVVLCSDEFIADLHKTYFNDPDPTDVISFPSSRIVKNSRHIRINSYLGDIVVSVDTARRACREYKTTLSEELFLYIMHGILHLLGYDDVKEKDHQAMHARQKQITDGVKSGPQKELLDFIEETPSTPNTAEDPDQ